MKSWLKKVVCLLFISSPFFFFVFTDSCYALRKRVRKSQGSGEGTTNYTSQGVYSQVRFRPDRQGLLINFSNFDNLDSGRYELVYEANGLGQGASGTIILDDTSTKELLFGTCSGGVCHYHQNITNARLSITSVLKNGTTILKPYRIRV